MEQVVDLIFSGCFCFHNFSFYCSSVHHEMSALEIALCQESVGRWVLFQDLGLPYSIAFEQCPLSSSCAFGVWHEARLRKLALETPQVLEKKIFTWKSVLRSWQLLASGCAETQRDIIPSLWVFLCNWSFSLED